MNILLIETDEDIIARFTQTVSQLGIKGLCCHVCDGEAHTKLEQKQFEVIVYGQASKGEDGLLKFMRHHDRVSAHTPVILLWPETSDVVGQDRLAYQLSPDDLLSGVLKAVLQMALRLEAQKWLVKNLRDYDQLTGLTSRHRFQDCLETAMDRQSHRLVSMALLCLDIDNFKMVNDTLGHRVGDHYLKIMAGRLSQAIDQECILSRMGADEFMILLSDLPAQPVLAEAVAKRVAETLLNAVAEPIEIEGRLIQTSASVGISILRYGGNATVDHFIKQADIALNQAKMDGRNRLCFFQEAMAGEAESHMELQSSLFKAFERDEFELYLQPIHSKLGLRCCGAEALIRWKHPVKGVVTPAVFLHAAQVGALSMMLNEWVLQAGCEAILRFPDLDFLSVNMNPDMFQRPDMVEYVRNVVEASGIDPSKLMIELTETSILSDEAGAALKIQSLRALGIKFAIDDFGTGYGTLKYLQKLPFDKIKMDRSFVQDIPDNRTNVGIVTATIILASSMNLQIVAEGIEGTMQLESLLQTDTGFFQGYYFSPPIPQRDFVNYLTQNGSSEGRAFQKTG